MRLVDAGVTVKDKIILHLLDHWGQVPRGVWPEALTQEGIAGVVGISRSHVAVTLPDLINEQMVEASTERVHGRARRVKVYGLSYGGGQWGGQLAQRLLNTTVTAVDDTGEWDIPLDGLIQVQKVHMMVAIRLVDEENRVDLRKATEMVMPVESREETPPELEEEEEGAEPLEEDASWVEATGDALPEPQMAGTPPTARTGPVTSSSPTTPDRPPTLVAPTSAPVQLGQRPTPPGQQGGADPQQLYPYGQGPQQAYFWSPLRFGSGRRPGAGGVAISLVLGFLSLVAGIAFFGVSTTTCAVLWIPLMILGVFFASAGFRDLWALGPRREAWTATALSAYAFLAVTMVAFAAFGHEAVVDLLWASLILGLPSMILMSGTGHSVARRGSFALVIGPVMIMAALTLAVLDPEGIGSTGAMPLFMVTVGTGWTFVGWVMTRHLPDVDTHSLIIGGGAIGLAIATMAGAADIAADDGLSGTMAFAVALWSLAAIYVAVISLYPPLAHLRPDAPTSYRATAVAGSAALLTASVIFLMGGLLVIGAVEAVIAVAMLVMVLPEVKKEGTGGLAMAAMGCVVAVASVVAVAAIV